MKIQLTTFLFLLLFQCNLFANCDCDWTIDMVCVETEDGNIIPFPNPCWAECLGYGDDTFIDCDYNIDFDPACGCSYEVEPVCVDDDGLVVLYPSACLAECQGFTEDDFLECEYDLPTNPGCGCNWDIEEVCVEVEEGTFIPFPNACWAECSGYDEDVHISCDGIFDDPEEAEEAMQYLYDLIFGDTSELTDNLPELDQQLSGNDTPGFEEPTVFPNPVKGNVVNLAIDLESEGTVRVDLMTVTGKYIRSYTQSVDAGSELLQLETNDLTGGIYYLNIYTESYSKTLKFLKR